MGDFNKSIHSRDESAPYEKIIVNPVEKDKKTKEEFKDLPQTSTPQVFATLVSFFKKIVTLFSTKENGELVLVDFQQINQLLIGLRSKLRTLSLQDESHNPEFTEQLSELWHKLQDDCNSASASSSLSPTIINKIKFFMSQISNYPPHADHTLGFYFNAFAGEEWIPFPFMDILQDLHDECQQFPFNNYLNNWIALINDILANEEDQFA